MFYEIQQFSVCLSRFLKSKVALLQTELEAGKNLNDTLEKENMKQTKKIKKLTTQADKSTCKIETLEASLKMLQEKHAAVERDLKVTIDSCELLMISSTTCFIG